MRAHIMTGPTRETYTMSCTRHFVRSIELSAMLWVRWCILQWQWYLAMKASSRISQLWNVGNMNVCNWKRRRLKCLSCILFVFVTRKWGSHHWSNVPSIRKQLRTCNKIDCHAQTSAKKPARPSTQWKSLCEYARTMYSQWNREEWISDCFLPYRPRTVVAQYFVLDASNSAIGDLNVLF